MMNFVFGPVRSKRLGLSLGIDIIPSKTCNWNCVYCQLGITQKLSLGKKRASFYERQAILDEVRQKITLHPAGKIEWITIVGSGEPCLNQDIGWLIENIKKITSLPIAVITNGSLLHLSEVRDELAEADAVLPSLDAGNEILFRKINRSLPELSFEKQVNGLSSFSKKYKGKLWLELMLIEGLNDSEEQLVELGKYLDRIAPQEIHLNLPTRPPAEAWVKPAKEEHIQLALEILGSRAKAVPAINSSFEYDDQNSLSEQILEMIQRHPVGESELFASLPDWKRKKIEQVLETLSQKHLARPIERYQKRFWSSTEASYKK